MLHSYFCVSCLDYHMPRSIILISVILIVSSLSRNMTDKFKDKLLDIDPQKNACRDLLIITPKRPKLMLDMKTTNVFR